MIEILIALVLLVVICYVIQRFVEVDAGLKNIILLVVVLIFLIFLVRQLGVVNF